ncbi:hypothetical protein ACFL3F_01780 [Planctomycetota bacterium]
MEATISGKYYDTDTAQLIYTWNNGVFSTSDFGYRSKVLYRTSNGNWFLHHEGGALTDCMEEHDNSRTGSEYIEPVGEEDVFVFLQAHGGEMESEEWFGGDE